MAKNPLKKMKAIDYFSGEMRDHMDNISGGPARSRAHRYVQYSNNRARNINDRVQRFNETAKAQWADADKAQRQKIRKVRERLQGQAEGDIAKAAGKGGAKALSDHIGERIGVLKGVDYDAMKKGRQQVLDDLHRGRTEYNDKGEVVREGVGAITRERLADRQAEIRSDRSRMNLIGTNEDQPGNKTMFTTDEWAKQKAQGATTMGYAQWKAWSIRREKEAASKALSDKIWRAELDRRKLDRAEQRLAAVDTMRASRDKEVLRLEGLQKEVGGLLGKEDSAAVSAVADKLAGRTVRYEGPDIQERMRRDIEAQDQQGATVAEVADDQRQIAAAQEAEEQDEIQQGAVKAGRARKRLAVLKRNGRRARR